MQLILKKFPLALQARASEALKKYKVEEGLSLTFGTTEGGLVGLFSKGSKQKQADWHSSLRKSLGGILALPRTSELQLFLDCSDPKEIENLVTLVVLSQWEQPKVSKAPTTQKSHKLQVLIKAKCDKSTLQSHFHRGVLIGTSINEAMTLSHTPANYLTPTLYRKKIADFAKKHNLKFEFWNESKLAKLGAHAFLAVSRGSSQRDAGIAHLQFKGPKAKQKIALVGKGICYDTGGYNIKPGNHMFGMHQDMTGSAIALALGGLIAQLKLPLELHVFLAIAENHVSPEAFKMNEVVYASNDKSIEIVHTDAEGRMVLSDTLALASKVKPELLIDFATLTGTAVRALGNQRAAVFSNQSKLWGLIIEGSEQTGEAVWPFPMGEEYHEKLKSKVADLRQCDEGGNADHIYAATFLSNFVDPGIKWLHMDLCPTDNKSGVGLLPKDGSGFGLRWALQMIEFFTTT